MSTPKSCVGGKIRSSKRRKTRTRRKIQKKRVVSSSRLSDGSFDNHDRSFSNPTFRGLSLSNLSNSKNPSFVSLCISIDFGLCSVFFDRFGFVGYRLSCVSLKVLID